MLLIRCPYCEEDRPELEFRNGGQAHIARSGEIATISDDDFEGYFFIRENPKGLVYERWRHVFGCGRFFNAARDSVTDKFLITYKAGEPKPDLQFPVADNDSAHVEEGQGNMPADKGPGSWANVPPAAQNVKAPARRRKTDKPEGDA